MYGRRNNDVMTLDQINRIAREELSRYEGYEDSYEGMDPFGGDDFVQFDGNNLSKNGAMSYTLTLTNSNAAIRTALISNGIIPSTPGLIATGAFNDKSGAPGLTGAGTPNSIEYLTNFYKNNPLRILTMRINTTDPAQLQQMITFKNESPFRGLETKIIPLSAHVSEETFKDKILTVPAEQYGLQLDNQTVIEFPVVGSSSVSITFFVGPILNTAGALDRKYKRAVRSVSQASQ